MTRIRKAAGGRSRFWLGLPLLAVVLGTLVLVQGALSQPTASRTRGEHAVKQAGTLRRATFGCGDTVPTNYILPADLHCTDNNGLTIGHDGITLNLNGHTISGTPTGDAGAYTGVNNPGHNHVVIENGAITGFFNGVAWAKGSGTVKGLRVFANVYGISAPVCCGTNQVAATITNNVVSGNSNDGIHLDSSVVGSVVSANRVVSNTNTGIYVSAPGATVSGNVANGNVSGMAVFSRDPALPLKASGNRAYWNDVIGIKLGPGDIDLGKNLAAGNGSAHQCDNIVCSP